jgi:RNA polymerase sigma-70 factor (ECF subfamily)
VDECDRRGVTAASPGRPAAAASRGGPFHGPAANHAVTAVSRRTEPGASEAAGDGELVRATIDGELWAFEQLVARYQRRATARAWRLLNDREDAMEVTQDAFLKAYDNLRSLTRPDRFGPWLLRIVTNQALNRRRYRALRKGPSLDAGDAEGERVELPDLRAATPEQKAAGEDLSELLWEAIGQLPETQRLALVMFSIDGMPQKDVAEVLDISVEAVKWHVFTARKKLRERLKDYL